MAPSSPLLRPSRLSLGLALSIALAGVVCLRQLPLPEAPLGRGTVAVQDVSVFDPRARVLLSHQDLLWTDGRISALRPSGEPLPPGAQRIDGRGFSALPGFCDAAVFLSLEGLYPQDSVPADPAESLQRQLSGGVTSVLDLNAHRTFMGQTRALVDAAQQPWPRLRFAGALFTAPGGWRLGGQTPANSHVAELSELEDLEASWPLHLRFRDQAVFASVEHEGREDLAIPLPVLQRLGELAHAQGVPFIIHAQHASKALQALAARPDAILGPLLSDEGCVELALAMKRARCSYLPALGTLLNGWPGVDLQARWQQLGAPDSQGATLLARASDPVLNATWTRHLLRQNLDRQALLRAVLVLYLKGVPLALGTGSGLPLVFHGTGRASEFDLWREAGVPVAEILRSATLNSHRLAGLEGGSLRPGERADLVLVAGDPLRDPSTLDHVRQVFIGGQGVALP
jgi:imidazolonepropionase-like amidohydrolase